MTFSICSPQVFAILFYFVNSCTPSTDKPPVSITQPEFQKTDSLTIHHKGDLQLLNWREDKEFFILHDPDEKQVFLTGKHGEILQQRILTDEDQADSLPDKFYSFHFIEEDQILMVGATHLFWLDDSLRIIKKREVPINQLSVYFNPGHLNLLHQKHLFTFGYEKHILDWQRQAPDFFSRHPLLWVVNLDTGIPASNASLPHTAKRVMEKGVYLDTTPFAQLENDQLFLLFPNTPMIFQFGFPDLELQDSIPLDPSPPYIPSEGVPHEEAFPGMAYDHMIQSSPFSGFYKQGELSLVSYQQPVSPQVYESYKNEPTKEGYQELLDKHKSPVYLLYEKDKKRWEGEIKPSVTLKHGEIIQKNSAGDGMEKVTTFYFLTLEVIKNE
jgi:hypothetical protein